MLLTLVTQAAAQDTQPSTSNDLTDAADTAGSGGIGGSETLGSEPEDYSLAFLRTQTVLIKPGQCQVDVGLSYAIAEDEFPVLLNNGDVVRGLIRQRLLLVPLEVRYGLTRRMQWFTQVPLGWSNTELSLPGYDEFDNKGGIGDIRAGLTMLLREPRPDCPSLTATFAFTAPTGNESFPLTLLTPEARLGEGFWALSASILSIHTYDPIILFYGLGARFRFEERFTDNLVVDPGGQYSYQLGVGFAVNEKVTLSGSFLGTYIVESRVNGQRLRGSILEPMRLRFSVTIARGCKIVEPFAEIGMTEDAAAANVGMVWTY